MSTPTTTTEEQLRLQQSYERLLRERRLSLLLGEAAVSAGAETQQVRHAIGSNPIWTPRMPPQPAAALQATGAYSGAPAQSPPAAESAARRHRELQALDLSRQPSQLWRHIGAPDAAVAGPSYVYGPPAAGTSAATPAATSAATSAAFAQIGRAPATYAQAATYSQVTRPLATYGPVAGPSTAQPQAAGHTVTCPHGHPIQAPTEAHRTPMGEHRMQASSSGTFRAEGPDPYVFTEEEESITPRMRYVFHTPQVVSRPNRSSPLDNAISSQAPTPLARYPPIIPSSEASAPQARNPPIIPSSEQSTTQARYPPIIPSSEGPAPQARYPPIIPSSEGSASQARHPPIIPSSEGSTLQPRYPPMAPSSEGATLCTGYVPATAFGARPSQAQMATQYGSAVSPSTAGFQQTWPAFTTHQQTGMTQGHQLGPSRNRSTNRASPYSGRRTPFQQPHYHRPAVPIEAGPSTGQAPSQGPFRATVSPHQLVEPVNFGGGKYETVPLVRVVHVGKKSLSGIPINELPGQNIVVREYFVHGRDEARTEPKTETNPEGDREADTDGEEADEGPQQFDVEEYEPGPDDGESEESSCSDGESEQQEVPTWQQAPWAAVGGPSSCQECSPGQLCFSCRCAATAAIGPAPESPGAADSPTSTTAATVSDPWPGSPAAGPSGVSRPSVIVAVPQSPESSSSDSSVRMIVVSEPENESNSADGDQTEQENDEEEGDGNEDQQESAEERRRNPREIPQQEPVHSTTRSP